jgi:riboflavin kinase/FMN adenylyltransferase
MKVTTGLGAYEPGPQPAAVAIGNFDGLHLGHRRILQTLSRVSRRRNLRSLVLTFHPHPEHVLGRTRTPMLQTVPQRLESLREAGVDRVLVTGFDRRFSGLSPQDFMKTVLKDKLNAAAVVVGGNFRFGRNRSGDVDALKALGAGLGLQAHPVAPVRKDGLVVSSSLIRGLLAKGRVEDAARYLGRPYRVAGRVIHGRAVGRKIGFPTANLHSENEILPVGVFITLARVGTSLHPSVTNIGFRPTFGQGGLSLETVLLDTGKNLYGRAMDVLFIKRIRPERKFVSPGALTRQIARDVQTARDYFKRHPFGRKPGPRSLK